jgi:hypothetical protein
MYPGRHAGTWDSGGPGNFRQEGGGRRARRRLDVNDRASAGRPQTLRPVRPPLYRTWVNVVNTGEIVTSQIELGGDVLLLLVLILLSSAYTHLVHE